MSTVDFFGLSFSAPLWQDVVDFINPDLIEIPPGTFSDTQNDFASENLDGTYTVFLGDVTFDSNIAPVFGEVNDIYRISNIDEPPTANNMLAAVSGTFRASIVHNAYLDGGDEFSRHVFSDDIVDIDSLSNIGPRGQNPLIQTYDGDRVVFGSIYHDTIFAGRGGDEVNGDGGNNDIFGGDRDDKLYGQRDSDDLYGEEGNDTLYGQRGSDNEDVRRKGNRAIEASPMSKTLLYGFAALVVTAFASSAGDANAGSVGGISAASPSRICQVAAPIVLAQVQKKRQMQQFRVPSGQNYVKRPGRRTFEKLATGVVLEGTDCVQVTCPASFDPDVTCWKCVESKKTPEQKDEN